MWRLTQMEVADSHPDSQASGDAGAPTAGQQQQRALGKRAPRRRAARAQEKPPVGVLVAAFCWLLALVVMAFAYRHWHWLHSAVPDPAGTVPLGVPWWGALGGLTISLVGIASPTHSWEDRFRLWHYLRPLLGAVSGSVGYLIVFGLFKAAGAAPNAQASGSAVFDAVAFLVGFREHIFWQLIARAVDLLLAPGTPSDNGSTSANPPGSTAPPRPASESISL
jgi:hypothetical protein